MITPVEMDRCIMSDEQEQESQALIPIIQQTIMFRGLPLVVVRLPDGRPGVVLRWICENLHPAPGPQVLRRFSKCCRISNYILIPRFAISRR